MFDRLQGLTKDNVMQSEGIKHYARTLVEALVAMLKVASDKAALDKLLEQQGKYHQPRKVNSNQLLSGEPIFKNVFSQILKDSGNKAAADKFLSYIFPGIAQKM